MWVANALSLVRAPLGVLFWLTYGAPAWSIAIVAAAAMSDALDGRVARWSRRRVGQAVDAPSAGDWLDPLADKIFVVLALAAIGAHDAPAWPVIALIIARELVQIPVMLGYWIRRAVTHAPAVRLHARLIGKATTVVQFVAAAVLAGAGAARAWPLAIVAAALGLAAVIEQLVRGRAGSGDQITS